MLHALGKIVTPGVKLIALADDLGLRRAEHAALRTMLIALADEGVVEVLSGGAFALVPGGRLSDSKGKRPRRATRATVAAASSATPKAAAPAEDGSSQTSVRAKEGPFDADEAGAVPAPKRRRAPTKRGLTEPARQAQLPWQPAPSAGSGGYEAPPSPEPVRARPTPAAAPPAAPYVPPDESAWQQAWATPAVLGPPGAGSRGSAGRAGSATKRKADGAVAHMAEPSPVAPPSEVRPKVRQGRVTGAAPAAAPAAAVSDVRGRGDTPSTASAAAVSASSFRTGAGSQSVGAATATGFAAAPVAALAPRYAVPGRSLGAAPLLAPGQLLGNLTVHPAGYGFVATDDQQTVFIPAKYRGLSLDGDRVVVSTWPGVRGTEGRVDDVVQRGRARLTGMIRQSGRALYLEPDDPRIAADHGRVSLEGAAMGADGEAVVVEITRYPTAARAELVARVLKVLGDPDDPRTEIEKIVACANLPVEFPEAALAQATSTASELRPSDFVDRIDLRAKRFCTIDPETARDFDDALCIEDRPKGGTRVWVAVADVAHYVRWGDALDQEAALRGVSVYLPDRVISMLPKQLSAGICSLNPEVERCAMVVRLDFDATDTLVETGYAAAVIRSHARLDYPGVAAALRGDFRGRGFAYKAWIDELTRLDRLAQVLRARRRTRGALELEIAEAKVVLDADDARLVRDVVRSKEDPAVKQAYELVEEYMIGANEAVGAFFRTRGLTSVWRVHAPPKPDRVNDLVSVLQAYGIAVDEEAARTPLGMKAILDEVAQKPAAKALSFLVLRTLTQATWDTVPIGHFGLASGDYLHFTSPIRRYPDLLVHRLLKHYLAADGQPSGGGYAAAPPVADELAALAHASSGFERRATEVEREAVAMYRTYLMRDHVGEQFPGIVSAVTNFGAFIEIDKPFVEGLVKNEDLGNEPFEFDGVHLRLVGMRTGKSLMMGDDVIVEVANVSVARRRVELQLVSGGAVRARDEGAVPGGVAARRRARAAVAEVLPRDSHGFGKGRTGPGARGRDRGRPRENERGQEAAARRDIRVERRPDGSRATRPASRKGGKPSYGDVALTRGSRHNDGVRLRVSSASDPSARKKGGHASTRASGVPRLKVRAVGKKRR